MHQQIAVNYTQASQMTGKSYWTLKRWVKQGKLQVVADADGKGNITVASLYKAMGVAPSNEAARRDAA
jgi:predicted site-specific integrase-resolvase